VDGHTEHSWLDFRQRFSPTTALDRLPDDGLAAARTWKAYGCSKSVPSSLHHENASTCSLATRPETIAETKITGASRGSSTPRIRSRYARPYHSVLEGMRGGSMKGAACVPEAGATLPS